MLELWGNVEYPFIAIIPRSTLIVVAPDRVLSMGQIELNYVLMLNWIVWNKTVFDIWRQHKVNESMDSYQ